MDLSKINGTSTQSKVENILNQHQALLIEAKLVGETLISEFAKALLEHPFTDDQKQITTKDFATFLKVYADENKDSLIIPYEYMGTIMRDMFRPFGLQSQTFYELVQRTQGQNVVHNNVFYDDIIVPGTEFNLTDTKISNIYQKNGQQYLIISSRDLHHDEYYDSHTVAIPFPLLSLQLNKKTEEFNALLKYYVRDLLKVMIFNPLELANNYNAELQVQQEKAKEEEQKAVELRQLKDLLSKHSNSDVVKEFLENQ